MSSLPDHVGVAFKEWSGVCEALTRGRQTLIVRKGGIAEGPAGFSPEHPVFWLYPTRVHQAQQGLREGWDYIANGAETDLSEAVVIDALARVEVIKRVVSADVLPALEPFHVWTPETLEKRFQYRQPGLWMLGVRVFRTDAPWTLIPTALQLGCTSWVALEPPLPTQALRPCLDDAEWNKQMQLLEVALAPACGMGARSSRS
jgi:hypothetical protein